jgi:hypothetical protein
MSPSGEHVRPVPAGVQDAGATFSGPGARAHGNTVAVVVVFDGVAVAVGEGLQGVVAPAGGHAQVEDVVYFRRWGGEEFGDGGGDGGVGDSEGVGVDEESDGGLFLWLVVGLGGRVGSGWNGEEDGWELGGDEVGGVDVECFEGLVESVCESGVWQVREYLIREGLFDGLLTPNPVTSTVTSLDWSSRT